MEFIKPQISENYTEAFFIGFNNIFYIGEIWGYASKAT